MIIFSDLHHNALTKSFKMTLEDRIGHEVYFPRGIDWYNKGYFLIAKPYNDDPVTINQYLEAPTTEKTMAYEEFLDTDIDVIMASYIHHVDPYDMLRRNQKPEAKLVHQMGNEWPVDFRIVKNLMASTEVIPVPPGVNTVYYHQEFDTDIYSYKPPKSSKLITSFVNTLREDNIFAKDLQDFLSLESNLKDYEFKAYGSTSRDGTVQGDLKIAQLMKDSFFGVHLKSGGDGYGHVIHNWAAVGRPLIYRGSQYKNKLGGRLLEHMVTGLDLDEMNHLDMVQYINSMTAGTHRQMCEAMHKKFTDTVNFEQEANDIRDFLGRLI